MRTPRTGRVSRSGSTKIIRALACGFRPANGFCGAGQYLRARRIERRARSQREAGS